MKSFDWKTILSAYCFNECFMKTFWFLQIFLLEKYRLWFWVILVQENSSSNLFYFLFLFATGKRTEDWKVVMSSEYKNIFSYPLFHNVLLKMTNGEKNLKNLQTEKKIFWNFSQDIFASSEKSVLFVRKLKKRSGTTRLQLNRKDLYIKDWVILNFLCYSIFYQYFIIRSQCGDLLWVSLCWHR